MTNNELPVDPTAFRPMKVTAHKDIPVGFELEPVVKKITLDKSRLYHFGWPRLRSRHNDYATAQKTGLRIPIVAGSQTAESLGELFIKFFGKGFVGGTLTINFIKMVYPDDTLTSKGVVIEKIPEGDNTRLVLDIWTENQNGDKVMVGRASGLVGT